jgi:SRSO17 transposase
VSRVWDADAVRDDVRGYVIDAIGDPGGGYLPASWTADPARCAAAGVPDDISFATKITLNRRKLDRGVDAGVPAEWATADEFSGGDRGGLRDLQDRRLGYVLAVARSHRVNGGGLHGTARADAVAAGLPKRAWNRYSTGEGAKAGGTVTARGSRSSRR